MSIDVMSDIWKHSPEKGSALLLLLAIADCANNHGVAHPSVPYLAKKGRMTERNVQLLFKRLAKKKLLRIELGKGPYGCHLLRLTLSPHYVNAEKGEKFSPPSDEAEIKETQERTAKRDEKISGGEKISGVKSSVKNTHEISPLPSLDPSVKTQDLTPHPPTPQTGNGCVRDVEAIQRMEAGYTPYTTGFLRFCAVYPQTRLIGQQEAFRLWQLYELEPRTDELMAKVEWLKTNEWRGKPRRFIPQINNWFERGHYNDPTPNAEEDEPDDLVAAMQKRLEEQTRATD